MPPRPWKPSINSLGIEPEIGRWNLQPAYEVQQRMPSMIELRQLRYLIAAAEAGSFSRAARNLNIKQATLSRHILEMEKRLGMTLFDRKTRGATLTENGATYLRSEEHTSELQSRENLVCRLLLEK